MVQSFQVAADHDDCINVSKQVYLVYPLRLVLLAFCCCFLPSMPKSLRSELSMMSAENVSKEWKKMVGS